MVCPLPYHHPSNLPTYIQGSPLCAICAPGYYIGDTGFCVRCGPRRSIEISIYFSLALAILAFFLLLYFFVRVSSSIPLHLLTYLPTYLPTYLYVHLRLSPTLLPTYLSIYLPTYISPYSSHQPTYLPTNQPPARRRYRRSRQLHQRPAQSRSRRQGLFSSQHDLLLDHESIQASSHTFGAYDGLA